MKHSLSTRKCHHHGADGRQGHAEAYRRAVDLNPRDYRAWYGLGQTYELLHMPYYALFYFRW